MKRFIFWTVILAASISGAAPRENTQLGEGVLEGANMASGNIVVGQSAGQGMTRSGNNILIGNNAGYKMTNSFGNVFVGNKGGYESGAISGAIVLGDFGGDGSRVMSDATVIGDHFFATKGFGGAFAVGPDISGNITNGVLYYKNGTLYLNSKNTVVNGEPDGFFNLYAMNPKPYYFTDADFPCFQRDYPLTTTNVGARSEFPDWHATNTVTIAYEETNKRLEFKANREMSQYLSSKVITTVKWNWKQVYKPWSGWVDTTEYGGTNTVLTIPLATTGDRFVPTQDTLNLQPLSPVEYSWTLHFYAKRNITADKATITLGMWMWFDNGGSPYQREAVDLYTFSVNAVAMADVCLQKEQVARMVEGTVVKGISTDLVTSKVANDTFASKATMDGVSAKFGKTFIDFPVNLKYGNQNLIEKIGIYEDADGCLAEANEQTPDADGLYVMRNAKGYRLINNIEEHGGYGSWESYDFTGIAWYRVYDASNFVYCSVNPSRYTDANGVVYSFVFNWEKNDGEDYGSKTYTFRNPKFKPTLGTNYRPDSRISRGALATTKHVYDETKPLRYYDLVTTTQLQDKIEFVRNWYNQKYTLTTNLTVVATCTNRLEDVTWDMTDGLRVPYPKHVTLKMKPITSNYEYTFDLDRVGASVTNTVNYYKSVWFNMQLRVVATHCGKYVNFTVYGEMEGYTYTADVDISLDLFAKRRNDYAMDSIVAEGCAASTDYVNKRLGGTSLQFEDGGISVYTNGVKAGTLTFTPTP